MFSRVSHGVADNLLMAEEAGLNVPPSKMKFFSWNYGGLGGPSAIRSLRGLLKKSSPLGLFLMETNVSSLKMEKISCSLNFENCHLVEGQEGGEV